MSDSGVANVYRAVDPEARGQDYGYDRRNDARCDRAPFLGNRCGIVQSHFDAVLLFERRSVRPDKFSQTGG